MKLVSILLQNIITLRLIAVRNVNKKNLVASEFQFFSLPDDY